MAVLFETSIGKFVVDLYLVERPNCSYNFLKLCKLKYYNYCFFHSIQPRILAQTGDPTVTGNGGYSIHNQISGKKYFSSEIKPKIHHRKAGLISMVNNGKNEHGSQFFITLGSNLSSFDGVHTVFGEITEGIEIVDILNNVHVGKDNVPLRDVRIYHTIIIHDEYPDPALDFRETSPEITDEQRLPLRIGVDEIIDDEDISDSEKQLIEKIKESKANAQILAALGDLPDEDVKPPENVLFVCNLNPITTDSDLEVIFSQFGQISSCEVIRDKKTGKSLSYAFIEFIEEKSCEDAYYKMEHVLIDDRRVHVDFSQSVSKQNNLKRQTKLSDEEIYKRKREIINKNIKYEDSHRKHSNYDDKYRNYNRDRLRSRSPNKRHIDHKSSKYHLDNKDIDDRKSKNNHRRSRSISKKRNRRRSRSISKNRNHKRKQSRERNHRSKSKERKRR